MNTPNNPTSLRTQKNQDIMEEWRGRTDRPKWVDLLAFKILEELIYEDARLKIGGADDADPVWRAYDVMKED
ncbi:MAG: hypothetical protein WCP55_15115 [Lentisphaerota bacterium]